MSEFQAAARGSGYVERGLDDETAVVRVVDRSGVGASRRLARTMAASISLSEEKTEKLALIVSEAAMNQLRYASGGEILLTRLRDGGLHPHRRNGGQNGGRTGGQSGGEDERRDGETRGLGSGIEMLAIDDGPGIVKLGLALRNDQPTSRGLGIGLGSIRRMSDDFAIHAPSGAGTAIMARLWNEPPEDEAFSLRIGAVSRARRGQSVCGDAWRLLQTGEHTYHLMVVDGLGHGRVAAVASRAALEGLRDATTATSPCDILRAAHRASAGTRGAAALVLRVRALSGEVDVSGVGNVQGVQWSTDRWRGYPTHPGTLGVEPIRIRQSTYSIQPGESFVIHTDGLSSGWLSQAFPGRRRLHPALLAASLYRDHGYDHDDTTVFVGRVAGRGTRGPSGRAVGSVSDSG